MPLGPPICSTKQSLARKIPRGANRVFLFSNQGNSDGEQGSDSVLETLQRTNLKSEAEIHAGCGERPL
jgi:hypothetical protein